MRNTSKKKKDTPTVTKGKKPETKAAEPLHKLVDKFYERYGEMMSRLSHE